MGLLDFLLGRNKPLFDTNSQQTQTSGELIAEMTDGANLVDGKQTWELVESKKNDIEVMKQCCDAEIKSMNKSGGGVAAPYYFKRVAILSRKEKNYKQEIFYCELYIKEIAEFYFKNGTEGLEDVRGAPTYQSIVKRLEKAKELQAKVAPL